MILKDLKKSMLFRACAYTKEPISMNKFHEINSKTQIMPETDIIEFYLGAHILGVVEDKFGIEAELPEDVSALVEKHHEKMEEVFFRIFTYLMLISVGESRHGVAQGHMEDISQQFGLDVTNYVVTVNKKTNRSQARKEFLQSDRDVLNFMEYCDWMFLNVLKGGSYGGQKWNNISHKVTQVLKGEISPFTMVDVAWALVHNTGSIFNKNTIYTNENSSDGLTQLLDMQRGGAIPALIMNSADYNLMSGFSVSTSLLEVFRDDVNEASQVLGEDLSQIVPLCDVAAAGALSHAIKQHKDKGQSTVADDVLDLNDNLHQTGDHLSLGVVEIPKLARGA